LVALSEVLARIKTGEVPTDMLNLWAIWIAIGLSGLVGWITLTGSLVAMFKLKGGFTIPLTKKWVRFPTWGPPWLNFVKVGLLIASFAFVVMTVREPENTLWVWAQICQ